MEKKEIATSASDGGSSASVSGEADQMLQGEASGGGDAASKPIRVGVVEDDAEMRKFFSETISSAKNLKLVFATACREEALHCLGDHEVDILLVDIGLPDGSGLDVILAASVQWPDCASLVSTVFGDEASIFSAIEVGARGYLLKDDNMGNLVQEIEAVHAGGSPISPMVARKILDRLSETGETRKKTTIRVSAKQAGLTPREWDVLQLISKGFTAEEAGRVLGISKHTVRVFVQGIYKKLKVDSKIDAVNKARRMGLISRV